MNSWIWLYALRHRVIDSFGEFVPSFFNFSFLDLKCFKLFVVGMSIKLRLERVVPKGFLYARSVQHFTESLVTDFNHTLGAYADGM